MLENRSDWMIVAALFGAASCVAPAASAPPAPVAVRPNVDSARELDRQGIKEYRTGHFTDAIAYFRSAYELGGPPSELWNIVRCREAMDDVEGASAGIDEYLGHSDLLPQDRAEATREAQALRGRPSMLTVMSVPTGALVTVDGKSTPGPTPVSIEVAPGTHTIVVQRNGYPVITQAFEARLGRAIIVSLDLERDGG